MREQAVPAPRGHKPPKPGDTGGGGVIVELAIKRLAERGTEVRFDTGATALVVDDDGAVVGATWKRYDESGAIRAGAVIIAAGGFVMNPEMIEEHAPRLKALFERGMALGNSFDDGLGIRMGESVGGVAEHMDGAFFTSPIYPPGDTLRGIIVNKEGRRFVAEDSYHARTASFLFDQPDAVGYLILDSETMAEPAYGFHPLIDGWETIEEMEEGLGIPKGNLAETMARYNADAANGEDTEFHKHPHWLTPLDHGPWGAYDLTPGKAFYSGFTLGGLKVSENGEVLREDGSAVPGAYAAGACASNICLDGTGYSSGTQLGEASFFGRRAGRHAAERATHRSPAG
jgi:succinate dehydrogenase/fumarate reductase flavoprotein subunit